MKWISKEAPALNFELQLEDITPMPAAPPAAAIGEPPVVLVRPARPRGAHQIRPASRRSSGRRLLKGSDIWSLVAGVLIVVLVLLFPGGSADTPKGKVQHKRHAVAAKKLYAQRKGTS